MSIQTDLDALVQNLAIAPSTLTPAPGMPVVAGVTPIPSQLTSVVTNTIAVALDWFGKGVKFQDALLTNTTTLGPLQVFDLTRVPPVADPGVPGLIGRLVGTVELPSQSTLDVTLQVQWRITDRAESVTFQPGVDYIATPDLASPNINVWLVPVGVDDVTAPATPGADRFLRARVTLSAGGFSSVRELPPVALVAPVLPIPTVVALFVDTEFNGAILVVVPANALVGSAAALVNALLMLRNVLTPLNAIVTIAAFIAGISSLVDRLQSQGHIQFRAADSIDNLNDITLIQNSWWQNDIEAEDELSSIILVGAAGKAAACHNDRSLRTGEGKFTITAGATMVAFSSDLHSKSPASGPFGGEIVVDNTPTDGWFYQGSFGDSLSSIQLL